MRGRARWSLLAAITATALSAAAAKAADIALLIDADAATEWDEQLAFMAEALTSHGYEVYPRQDATRGDIAAVLAEIAGRLAETERLILFYAGETLASGERAWLLPRDFEGEGRIGATFDGVPLDALLDLAGALPGRAAVVIGTEGAVEEAPPGTEGYATLMPGIGRPGVPQGVLLVAGPVEAAIAAVTEGLLVADLPVADALAPHHAELEVRGFLSPEPSFVAAPTGELGDVLPSPRPEPEAIEPEPDPSALAEAAEVALALDVAARRRIQEQLTVLGYDTRGIDGVFGPGTRGAIAQWQQDQDLAATGFVNPEQMRLLTALADARAAELAAAAERARLEEEAADAAFWRSTGANGAAADLRSYLERYPDGIYAAEARAELDRLDAAARADARADDREAWDAAEAQDSADAYRRYLEAYPTGAFADQAQARIDQLSAAPERDRAVAAAAATEEAMGLNQGSRALIEGQLAAIGYDAGAQDGTFDEDTRRALREFQTRQGLEVTGYVSQGTIQAMIIASLGLR